jgi:hypothetical protein
MRLVVLKEEKQATSRSAASSWTAMAMAGEAKSLDDKEVTSEAGWDGNGNGEGAWQR